MQAVIDFVGSSETFSSAISLVQRGGAVVSVGIFGGSVDLPTITIPIKALSVHGAYVGSLRELGCATLFCCTSLTFIASELVSLLSKAGANIYPPLDERPLSEVNKALDDVRKGRVVGRVVMRTSAALLPNL